MNEKRQYFQSLDYQEKEHMYTPSIPVSEDTHIVCTMKPNPSASSTTTDALVQDLAPSPQKALELRYEDTTLHIRAQIGNRDTRCPTQAVLPLPSPCIGLRYNETLKSTPHTPAWYRGTRGYIKPKVHEPKESEQTASIIAAPFFASLISCWESKSDSWENKHCKCRSICVNLLRLKKYISRYIKTSPTSFRK